MWLVYRDADIDAAYLKPWQRVEAFRSLIKQTHQAVAGDYQPADGTGILDIHALLKAELPAADALEFEDQKAVDQIF